MSRLGRSYRLTVAASLLMCILQSIRLAHAEQSEQHSPLTIRGFIQHSESLPAITTLKVGEIYDDSRLPEGQRAMIGYWWKVPKWLEGTWYESGKVRVLSMKDLLTGREIETKKARRVKYQEKETIGFQKDQEGTTWTCVPVPYVRKDTTGDLMNVNIITSAEAIETTDESVTLMLTATTATVRVSTGKVLQVTQRESMQTYKPLGLSRIEVASSVKFFGGDGKPLFSEELSSRKYRTNHYVQLDELPVDPNKSDAINLQMSFTAFLLQHGLRALVPDRLIPENMRAKFRQSPH